MTTGRWKVSIFTDGAARGNPDGPGGYGAIIRLRDEAGNILEKELSGGFPKTTNNRMELMAPIAALEELGKLDRPSEGLIYSDSRYLVDAFEKYWIRNWQKNGWVTSSKAPVKNQDLWNRLLEALAPHDFHFRWVKGHADHPENERCDRLATSAADRVGWSLEEGNAPFAQASDWMPVPADAETAARHPSPQAEKMTLPADANKPTGISYAPFLPHFSDAPDAPFVMRVPEASDAPFVMGVPEVSNVPESLDSPDMSKAPEAPRKILIHYISDRIEKLRPPTDTGNWVDLRAAEDVVLKKGEYRLIRLGVAMKLPDGYEAHVVPRSSTFKNFGIIQANQFGVIDSAYCGNGDEWMMPVFALRDTRIHVNDRICQFRIVRRQPDLIFEETDRLDGPDRGGFHHRDRIDPVNGCGGKLY